MGLESKDRLPVGISLREAYSRIRRWYQENTKLFVDRPAEEIDIGRFVFVRDWSKHAAASLPLVEALPNEREVSELEIRAIFAEVIAGKLEWAYHESDGEYKMAAYAHAALDEAGLSWHLSAEEKDRLKASRLYPLLSDYLKR